MQRTPDLNAEGAEVTAERAEVPDHGVANAGDNETYKLGRMSANVSDSTRYWRRLFLVLETIVVGVFSFSLLAESFWGLRVEPQSQVWSVVFGVPIMLALLFLLIASPFFLRSLRGVALAGWIIA